MVLVLRDGRLVPPRRGSPLRCRVFDKYRIASYTLIVWNGVQVVLAVGIPILLGLCTQSKLSNL